MRVSSILMNSIIFNSSSFISKTIIHFLLLYNLFTCRKIFIGGLSYGTDDGEYLSPLKWIHQTHIAISLLIDDIFLINILYSPNLAFPSPLSLTSSFFYINSCSIQSFSDKLRKYFSVYGTVQDAVVMKDPVSRRSRGFGFITFTDINSVDNTLANEPHTIDARKVEAKRAVPRSESRDVNMNMNTNSPSTIKTAANRSSSTSSDNSNKSGATQPPGSPVVSVAGDPTKSPSHAQIMSESKNACDPRIAVRSQLLILPYPNPTTNRHSIQNTIHILSLDGRICI